MYFSRDDWMNGNKEKRMNGEESMNEKREIFHKSNGLKGKEEGKGEKNRINRMK